MVKKSVGPDMVWINKIDGVNLASKSLPLYLNIHRLDYNITFSLFTSNYC